MLSVLTINEYEPNPAEHLLAAFRVLDPESKGYIKKDIMRELLTTKGIHLKISLHNHEGIQLKGR